MKGMKRTIIVMTALVAFVASSESFNFLAFTKSNGSTEYFSVEDIKLTYDATNVYITNVEGSATIALSDLTDMYFSNEAIPDNYIFGDVNGDREVNIADVNTVVDAILSDSYNMGRDVNGDGEINIADINTIIDIILSH
jgi:hypothetical protein